MNVAAALKNCPLFSALPERDLLSLAGICVLRRCGSGAPLFSEGDPCDRFYVVASGRVKVARTDRLGREQILHVVHPGESFAEAALFSGGSFPASAETLEDSELIVVPGPRFLELLRGDPGLSLRLLGSLSRWLRRLVDLVEDLSLKDVQARLAVFLLREASARSVDLRSGVRIPIGTTKALLARRLGTVGETLSRTLYRLQKAGAIRVAGRDVFVVDPAKLRAAASGAVPKAGRAKSR